MSSAFLSNVEQFWSYWLKTTFYTLLYHTLHNMPVSTRATRRNEEIKNLPTKLQAAQILLSLSQARVTNNHKTN